MSNYRVKPSHPILAKVDGKWVEAKWKIAVGPQKKGPDGKSRKESAYIRLADGKDVKVAYADVRFLPNGMDEQAMFLLRDLNAAELPMMERIPLRPDMDKGFVMADGSVVADPGDELPVAGFNTVWRSVTDTAADDEVVWENELRDAYVMVDTETGNVFTYLVNTERIASLEDLQDFMQINGWRLATDGDVRKDNEVSVATSFSPSLKFVPPSRIRVLDDLYMDQETYDKHLAEATKAAEAFPAQAPVLKTAAGADVIDAIRRSGGSHSGIFKTVTDARHGDDIWYVKHGEKHYTLIDEVLGNGIGFDGFSFLPNEDFGVEWGFANPYKPAGEEIAAEQPDDAQKENNEPEEAVKPNTEMLALRWDTEVLGEERFDYRVWGRQPIKGERHYVVQTSGGNILFMPSVTTVLKASMPKPDALLSWAIDSFSSYKEYMAYMDERTGFGSVVHGVIADAINGVTGDLDDRQWWLDYLKVACARNGCPGKERQWLVDVQKSLMSVRQWAADYRVKFLMVEKALYAPHTGIAGQIDFLVEMDSHIQNVKSTVKERRLEPTRVLAMVDLKTGKDSDQYPAQLAMYTRMLFEGFPRIKEILAKHYPAQSTIDGDTIPCYLLFPEKGWRNKPKAAKMLDRTEKAAEYAQSKMNHQIALFKAERPAQGGKTILQGPSGFSAPNSEAVGYKTLADIWMDKINEGELEPIEDVNEEEDQE